MQELGKWWTGNLIFWSFILVFVKVQIMITVRVKCGVYVSFNRHWFGNGHLSTGVVFR